MSQSHKTHPSQTDPSRFIGIDVSKATLDVAVRPQGTVWQVSNDEAGVTRRGIVLESSQQWGAEITGNRVLRHFDEADKEASTDRYCTVIC